ncbi:gluconokinase [Patulibacter sp. SYSU D01012]|uniref:gluconokinase n=1 Tax=Patulibacter sp. SYSU D01012 TaxID=2817381 RepID=UPI001B30F050
MSPAADRSPLDVVLGVDAGTTSVKTTGFAVDGRAIAGAEVGYPLDEPHPGHAEQDPVAIDDALVRTIREAAAAVRQAEPAARIRGISLSTAMHGIAALDEHDAPLTALVTWADTRADEQAERLRAEHPELHDRTGTPIHPMAPLPKLVWFRAEQPETFAAARRWVGRKELALHRLTGEWVVDHSLASGMGLFSVRDLDWDPEALRVAGIEAGQLARPVPTTCVVGTLTADAARETGLPQDTPVVAGAGDGPLANLGVGAVRPGVAACSIGTSGALRLAVERPTVDRARRLFSYALEGHRWVTGGAINNGGVVLEWAGEALAPDLGAHAHDELLDLAAAVPAGSDGLVMLPYLLSERAPHWSATPRGAYVGLTRAHGRGHLIRAAVEGVCQQLALVLASMQEAGNRVDEIRATGGFARSPFWRQLLADVLGAPVGFAEGHEGSGFGAALLGMQALGLLDSIDAAADLVTIAETVEPDPETAERYAELLPFFASVYDALAPTFRDLRRFAPH